MNATELKKVVLFSALLFTKDEIRLAMMDDSEMKNFDSAFARGWINEQYEIRKALFTAAKTGNVSAQKEWMALRTKLDLDAKRKR
ncbi:MAG: hypothetical protein QM497_04870 [Sulfurimonas sp.]